MSWNWKLTRSKATKTSFVDAYCPECGVTVHRETRFALRALWWMLFGAGRCYCQEPPAS